MDRHEDLGSNFDLDIAIVVCVVDLEKSMNYHSFAMAIVGSVVEKLTMTNGRVKELQTRLVKTERVTHGEGSVEDADAWTAS